LCGALSFVGGHPMAGSEAAGVEAARADLFVDAAYVLTPTEHTDPRSVELMRAFAEGIGSRVIVTSPEAHDRCVAVISHLPHLIASALIHIVQERAAKEPEILEMIAGSFRDMTRVAGSSPVLWRDICLSNAESLREAVKLFEGSLADGMDAVLAGDGAAFEQWFDDGKKARDSIRQLRKNAAKSRPPDAE
jgi:prephenate dehydrogenase